jgi:hypothetical protein
VTISRKASASCALGGETPQQKLWLEGIPNLYTSAACIQPPFVRSDSKPEPSDYPALAAFDTKVDRKSKFPVLLLAIATVCRTIANAHLQSELTKGCTVGLRLKLAGSRHGRCCQASLSSHPFAWPQKLHIPASKTPLQLVTNFIKGSRPRIMSKSLNDLQHTCLCLPLLPLKVFLWPVVDTVTHQA